MKFFFGHAYGNRALQLSIGLALVFASTSLAEIQDSTYSFAASTTGGTQIGATNGSYTDPANAGFCVGPPVACSSGAGVSGGYTFTDISSTDAHITFNFSGSTDSTDGTFAIDLSNFQTPDGSAITGISYLGGNLLGGDFSNVSWDAATGDATFTGTANGGYNAIDGVSVTFDVSEVTPEPASLLLSGLGLAGLAIAGLRRKRQS